MMNHQNTVNLYINEQNQVCYCDYPASKANNNNACLRRYQVQSNLVGMFIRYYQLRLHPEAKKNITNN